MGLPGNPGSVAFHSFLARDVHDIAVILVRLVLGTKGIPMGIGLLVLITFPIWDIPDVCREHEEHPRETWRYNKK